MRLRWRPESTPLRPRRTPSGWRSGKSCGAASFRSIQSITGPTVFSALSPSYDRRVERPVRDLPPSTVERPFAVEDVRASRPYLLTPKLLKLVTRRLASILVLVAIDVGGL